MLKTFRTTKPPITLFCWFLCQLRKTIYDSLENNWAQKSFRLILSQKIEFIRIIEDY